MTARRGGRAINGMSRSFHLWRGRGGFPIRAKGKPPRLRQLRWLREILLMTQPPLLAVVQGGECAGAEISALRVGTYTANSSVTAPWGRNFHRTWTIKPACRLKSLLRTPDHITQESHWISTKTEALSYFAFGASVLEV